MASKIQIRRDTASNWTSVNPTLSNGELGLETDTKKLKAGDGSTAWTSLAYYTLATAGYAAYADTTANFTGTLQEGGSNVVTAGDLGTNVATFLGTPSSANLASAVTDETGSGALAFATSPTFVTPALGTPSALVATNATGTAASLTAGVATLANAIKSATTTVNTSSATAPSTGQVLTATGASAATWQAAASGTPAVVIETTTALTMAVDTQVTFTNAGLTTITLPASPSSGDLVWITPANSLTTNIIARNGSTIMDLAQDLTIDVAKATVRLRYTDSSWRLV
jgi:hypothetical protein